LTSAFADMTWTGLKWKETVDAVDTLRGHPNNLVSSLWDVWRRSLQGLRDQRGRSACSVMADAGRVGGRDVLMSGAYEVTIAVEHLRAQRGCNWRCVCANQDGTKQPGLSCRWCRNYCRLDGKALGHAVRCEAWSGYMPIGLRKAAIFTTLLDLGICLLRGSSAARR